MSEFEEFNELWADRETRDAAKAHAVAYVKAHEKDLATLFADLTIEQFVQTVDLFRQQGREDMVAKAEMWNLAKIPPQRIIGSYGPVV
jgi:precorrin-4 methylase